MTSSSISTPRRKIHLSHSFIAHHHPSQVIIIQRHYIYILIAALCMSFIPTVTRSAAKFARSSVPLRFVSPATRATQLSGIGLPFAFFGTSATAKNEMGDEPKVKMSESEWQAKLSPEQVCRFLRELECELTIVPCIAKGRY
jgi:hypothetical protein